MLIAGSCFALGKWYDRSNVSKIALHEPSQIFSRFPLTFHAEDFLGFTSSHVTIFIQTISDHRTNMMLHHHLVTALLLTEMVSGQKVVRRRRQNKNKNVSRFKLVGSTRSTGNLDSNSPILFLQDASFVEVGNAFERPSSKLDKKADRQVSLNIQSSV
jgi:hypothetical protein